MSTLRANWIARRGYDPVINNTQSRVKTWVQLQTYGPAIVVSHNVTSLTDLALGNVRVNYTSGFMSSSFSCYMGNAANYNAMVCCTLGGSSATLFLYSVTANTIIDSYSNAAWAGNLA